MREEFVGFFVGTTIGIIYVLVWIIFIMKLNKKSLNKFKQTCTPERFELIDILFVPEFHKRKGRILKKLFILKIIETGEMYVANIDEDENCFSNIISRHCFTNDKVSNIKITKKDSEKGEVEVSIGDTGICYVKEILPFRFEYLLKRNGTLYPFWEYHKCTYRGIINENTSVSIGEYINCDESEDVLRKLQELKQMKGIVEFDEI